MSRMCTVILPVIGALCFGCAGELEDPGSYDLTMGEEKNKEAGVSDVDGGVKPDPLNDDAGTEFVCNGAYLVEKRCVSGCHTSTDGAAGRLDLESEGVSERLKDVPGGGACSSWKLLDSSNPSKSLVYLKVTDDPPCEPRMPIGKALTAAEQACVLEWLEGL